MQPDKPISPRGLDQESDISLDSETPFLSSAGIDEASQTELYAHRQRNHALIRFGGLGLAALLIVAGIVTLLLHGSPNQANVQLRDFPVTHVTLPNLDAIPQSTQQSMQVNGQLEANDSIVLAPTTRPYVPVIGQMYFDESTKQLLIYNGTGFQSLGNTITNTHYSTTQLGDTVINNITEGITSPAVLLQGSTPGNVQNGNFNISGTGQFGNLSVTGISHTASLDVSGNATINTASIQNTLTAGKVTTNNISAPSSGVLAISTPNAAMVTGSVNIHTGDSSTTASGDITIDTGAGIVDGELLETKGFEDGVDGMQSWYSTTLATTTDQAHGGSQSLQVTAADSGGYYGVQSNINASGAATPIPGHTYYFSLWVRANTVPKAINVSVKMGSNTTTLTTQTDSTTKWTQITGTGQAAADATKFYYTISFTGTNGDIHYFDDMQITDLSSASAASQISIGATNTKLITIGNMNEIGATTINGSSGITLNSGNGSIQENGGVISLNASAASSFTASRGSLTLTGAATSSWGIIQAASGIGGDLTIHAGKGGSDTNNNGGNLILQGGGATGTGVGGSVIVRPTVNTTAAFQVQNAAASTLLDVDTTTSTITITNLLITGTITVGRHIITTNTTGSTLVSTQAGAGSGATATITGNDTAGTITITTGASTGAGALALATFAQAYGANPIVVLTPANAAAAALPYYYNATTSTFSIMSGSSPTAATTYAYSYHVMQ